MTDLRRCHSLRYSRCIAMMRTAGKPTTVYDAKQVPPCARAIHASYQEHILPFRSCAKLSLILLAILNGPCTSSGFVCCYLTSVTCESKCANIELNRLGVTVLDFRRSRCALAIARRATGHGQICGLRKSLFEHLHRCILRIPEGNRYNLRFIASILLVRAMFSPSQG
jgi:hypothetical protein